MSNLRDFDSIYSLAQTKISELERENASLQGAISRQNLKEKQMLVTNILHLAEMMAKYNVGKIKTDVRYKNNYADQKRGKYSLYLDRDDKVYIGKTRNTCISAVFTVPYTKVNKKNAIIDLALEWAENLEFAKEFNLKYELTLRGLQDYILEHTAYVIKDIEEKNAELRKQITA